jgi:hypothetical protein
MAAECLRRVTLAKRVVARANLATDPRWVLDANIQRQAIRESRARLTLILLHPTRARSERVKSFPLLPVRQGNLWVRSAFNTHSHGDLYTVEKTWTRFRQQDFSRSGYGKRRTPAATQSRTMLLTMNAVNHGC